MKYVQGSVYILLSFFYSVLHADVVITLFMKPYPVVNNNTITDKAHAQKISKTLRKPGKIDHHRLHGILDKSWVSGIFSTYSGYLSTSDTNGQTFFPLRHADALVYLLITEKITPILMAGNTIHHWELETNTPAAFYKVERKQDEDTQLFYWDVQEEPLPTDNVIPLEAITIFAKPQNIYVPTGITPTQENTNLVLPDIYVKKGIKIYTTTLYVLNLRHFFAETDFIFDKRDNGYSVLINP